MGVYSLPDALRPSQPSPSPSLISGVPSRCKQDRVNTLLGVVVLFFFSLFFFPFFFWGGEGAAREQHKSRHRGCTCAGCASTHMPTHSPTHAWSRRRVAGLLVPPRPSCLNFPLFPGGSPDLWHGRAPHGSAAPASGRCRKEPHTNLCQLFAPHS